MTVADALAEARTTLAGEWERRSPETPEEIAAFYRDSEALGADMDAWHATPERQEWTRTVVQVAGANGVERVLDVGAGGGHDLRALRAEFPGISLLGIEPNWALRHHLNRSDVANCYREIRLAQGQFDLVICIDVLEHVPAPGELLAEIMKRVKVGGLLIEATASHDQGTPLHLVENYGWEASTMLRENGFEAREQAGRLVIWQKTGATLGTVIMCAHREVSVPTVECLFELVGRGWPIAMVYGDALIDRARAKALSSWYRKNETDVALMIDDDIVFRTEDAERVISLAREKRSIACGAYPVGDGGHLASRAWPGERIHFGPEQDPRKIRWPATGFMAVHRDVVTAMVATMELCYPDAPDAFWPMFTPFAMDGMYLSEDYAFGERALRLGFDTWLDPKSILIHMKVKGLSVLNMPGAEVKR
jgi:SAM-dependent methyltransferase